MSASLVVLERFDSKLARRDGGAPGNVLEQRLRAEAFAEGYAAGEAAAAARADGESRFIAAVSAALEAQSAAGPRECARQAGEALKLILIRIFPIVADRGFAAEAAAVFARAAKDVGGAIEIAAPADKVEPLKALLEKTAPGAPVAVIADPALKGAAAAAKWTGGGVDFDLDTAARDVIAAFDAAMKQLESEK